jgi:asparagine synthase (glutamine-hydrolysing)
LLLKRLYGDIPGVAANNFTFLKAFFNQGLTDTESPYYSHAIRWRNTRRTTRFFSESLKCRLKTEALATFDQVSIPPQFQKWDSLAQSQYLEISVFLSQYLLCSQGDRVAMANSVEGRFPFLDHRMVEFCNRLPSKLKLRGLTEKYLLKKLGAKWLPPEIVDRPKRPYRSPIQKSFFNDRSQDYVNEILSPESIRKTGLFDVGAVSQLVKKIRGGASLGETDDMALVGIISTQLLHRQFVESFPRSCSLPTNVSIKICDASRRTA